MGNQKFLFLTLIVYIMIQAEKGDLKKLIKNAI